mgnify:CR=1 FL=1
MSIDYQTILIESENLLEQNKLNKIRKWIKNLLTTRVGTVVCDRDFGIPMDFIDKPLPIAKQLYVVNVVRKIKKYIPGIKVESITFKAVSRDRIDAICPVIKISA